MALRPGLRRRARGRYHPDLRAVVLLVKCNLNPFFFGRLITDGVLVFSGKYASTNLSGLLHGEANWKTLATVIAGLIIIGIFLFIDWRQLLEHRKLRFRFKILRFQR